MFEDFRKAMSLYNINSAAGEVFSRQSKIVSDHLFKNSPSYHRGMIYDWDLNPIEEVDFKLEKVKHHTAEGKETEFYVQFTTDFHPEHEYKDLYYKPDGRERFGFYLDVYDDDKDKIEKWLIVNKDDRQLARYNAFKCNWIFEWTHQGQYYSCLGCVRDAVDNSFNGWSNEKLGGSSVSGVLSLIVPVTRETMTILMGQRFVISDNLYNPQTFEVKQIKDTSPLGIMRAYMEQREFNAHKDYFGIVNQAKGIHFNFDLPLADLPEGFGGPYHGICDCIDTDVHELKPDFSNSTLVLSTSASRLYVNGSKATVTLSSESAEQEGSFIHSFEDFRFRYFLNDQEYDEEELAPYLDIQKAAPTLTLQAVDNTLIGYVLSIKAEALDEEEVVAESNEIVLEVVL